jgi:hypothetical protein
MPLGLNVDSPFCPISDPLRSSPLPPPGNITEDEVRRNTFWLLYAMERMGGCNNGWALSLDDQDVVQLLPVKGVNFDLAVSTTSYSLRVINASWRTRRPPGQGANGNTP